jgi:hypothetical protein
VSYYYQTNIVDQQEQTYRRDDWPAHLTAVGTLRHAGIEPPSAWSDLLRRYTSFVELANPAIDHLIAEILSPTGAEVGALRAAALAEEIARTADDAAINQRVQAAVLQKLLETYAPVAQRNYKTAVSRFDDAAKRFTDVTKLVDVEGTGETLVSSTHAARDAWLSAPALAADVEEQLRLLLAAAALTGARQDVAYINEATDTGTAELQIALCANPKGAHRRRVWEAWATKSGRTGRWGALRALNVEIRAAREPVGLTPYARPQKPVPVARPGGQVQNWDPHDGDLPRGWKPVNVGWMAEHPSTTGVL